MSENRQFKIQATQDTIRRLTEQSDRLGCSISPNGIASIATFEISRVRPEDFWHAIGAIRQYADQEPAQAKKSAPRPNLTA
jgi:hypothetical protein